MISPILAPILRLKNLSVTTNTSNQLVLVEQLNLEINTGEIVALVGESGSGKSLTGLSILGLLPRNLTQTGQIIYQGNTQNKTQMHSNRGKQIALIFQDSHNALNPVFSIGNQLLETLQTHQTINKNQAQDKINEWLAIVQLDKTCFNKYSYELSGGQKQRIMIAIALMCGAKLIIADEPTTALDVNIQKEILALLKQLQQKYQLSILFITHDLGVVKSIANKVVVLKSGQVLLTQCVDDFFNKVQANTYVQALLNTLPVKNTALDNSGKQIDKLLLSLKDVNLSFPIKSNFWRRTIGQTSILNNINLELSQGDNLAIVGESGSGKSTIANIIMAQLSPNTGLVEYENNRINTFNKTQKKHYAQSVQIIFQHSLNSFNPRKILLETLLEGMTSLEVSGANKATLNALFAEVGLDEDLLDRLPHQLSGGQLQRAAIVRALCVKPKVIICDEPTSALDSSHKKQVLDLLLNLAKKHQMSYILITHDMSVVRYFCTKVMVLKSGRIIEAGLTKNLLNAPQSDYTKLLIESVL